ncbi:Uncharacterized protein PCOAH_00009400 [Plasmodium coatneyi]|uniref:Uncharacterized protein n=1 Tax=Plasmodium coatneyi TaxID=208452 RepID=A0A1B1DV12_9APIC|nr:Uncharacterized protein PCOAH_00009400 [Plasmodium coatneyi]ANQ06489.1 Uncharacterized protein PCOAH_00009400 [Plasmodium coatneyi]
MENMDEHHLTDSDEGSGGTSNNQNNPEEKPPPKGKTNKGVQRGSPPPHSPQRCEDEGAVNPEGADSVSDGGVNSNGEVLVGEEKPGEDNANEEAPNQVTIENKSLEEKPLEEKPLEEKPLEEKPLEGKPLEGQNRGSLAQRSTKSDSTNTTSSNLIKISQKSEEWEQPKKWSFSLLLTNIKSMVLTNYIYVAKRCGIPNQPNKPGPVLAISVEKENTNEVKNLIVQTPCAYEKYTLKGKLIQHKTLYPCTVTCMMYGSIGGIGKTVILGLQNGCILVYKSIEFECILKLNTRECLEKYFKGSSASSARKPFNNSHVKGSVMGTFSGTNGERNSGKFATQGNSPNDAEDYNDLSYQISGLSVKSTFANFIHWIIAGNMQGYIFVWEVPSGNIIKILVHPHHLFGHVRGGSHRSSETSDDSSDSDGSSDNSYPDHAILNGSNGGQDEEVVDTSSEKEEELDEADDEEDGDDNEDGCFTLEEDDSCSKPDGEENSSEFSGGSYLSDSDEYCNSTDQDNGSRAGDTASAIGMLHRRRKKKRKKEKNAPNKCYVSAILAVTQKYELWVAFGSGYIAVYDLYDFQLLLYTCISKSPIMDLKYSKLLEDVFLLIGNNYISVWDTKTLKQIKKVPTSHVTKKNSSLSTLYLLERPTFWKSKKVVLIAGCNDGSISVTNVTKKVDGDLTFSYVRTYEKHFEPYVPISYICIHPSINAAFVGDASGVVFTLPRILNTLKHDDAQR